MNIGIVDAIIIIILGLGAIIGFKEGAIKKLTSIVGLILVVIISFELKNYLSVFFYENLPFFDLWGIFKGIQIINVVFYEMLAFLIISSILTVIYRLLLGITGIIEKILKATIILSIPSKIIGFFVGLLEYYIWIYLFLFVLTLPIFNINQIYESNTAMFIITQTPILSKYTNKTLDIYNDLYKIIDNRENKSNETINAEAMELMLEHKIITPSSAHKLVDRNKVSIKDDSFISKYE